MPDMFSAWFIPKMDKIDYEQFIINSNPVGDFVKFRSRLTGVQFGVVYVKRPMTLDAIKIFFNGHASPLLFVVDSDLVTPESVMLPWLRAIHALHFGRIYVWDGIGVCPIHHDMQSRQLSDGGYIDLDVIKFEHVDCWYPGFPGQYHVAGFDDGPFWKGQATKRKGKPKGTKKEPNENESYWQQEFRDWEPRQSPPHEYGGQKTYDEVFRDFAAAFERNKQAYDAAQHHAPPTRQQYAPMGDKWFMMLMAEGSLEGAKAKYRALALQYHPDKAGDSPEVIQAMQAINAAYAKAKRILA